MLRASVPRFLAPVPYNEGESEISGAGPTSLFEVDMEISRVTQEIRKLEEISDFAGNVFVPDRAGPKTLFRDLPSLSEIPPPAISRAPPTATAAGFEERQSRIQEAHEAARRRLEISRKFHADKFIREVKDRHYADLLKATPVANIADAHLLESDEDDEIVRRYFG